MKMVARQLFNLIQDCFEVSWFGYVCWGVYCHFKGTEGSREGNKFMSIIFHLAAAQTILQLKIPYYI